MKKLAFCLLLALVLSALPAFGQSTTVVSGTVADSSSLAYSGGSLVITQNGFTIPPNITLNSAGQFSQILVQGTGYTFTVKFAGVNPPIGTGPQTCTASNQTISGSTQTISFTCPALSNVGSGSGSVTSVATTTPITGGTITSTGTIACATCGVTGSPLSQFASTTSAQLAGVLSDEASVGGGLALFASGFQGTDSNALTAGTVSGSGVTLCTDSNGGATTTGCSAGGNTTSTSGTSGSYAKFNGTNSIINGTCDSGITTANTFTCSDTAGAAFAGPVKVAGTTAGGNVLTAGTANGHATASTVTVEAPAAVTAYELVLPGTSASGIVRRANASNVDTESISELSGDATTSGSNALTLATVNTNVGSFTAANITVNGKGLITAASNGSAGVTVTKDSLTGQTANIGSRTLLTPGGNGLYRAQAYIVTTTAAATTSTLPIVQITFTDADTSVAKTLDVTNTSGTNAVGNFGPGGYSVGVTANGMINAKSGVAIQWDTTSYASNLANTMTYSVYVVLEGPF